jgi:hypothetical protein
MDSRSLRYAALARALAGILYATSGAIALAPLSGYAQDAQPEAAEEADVTSLSGITVTDDPLRVLPNEVSASSFGFAKPLLETPRSVSFVSEEQIALLGISTADDLSRLVPGTYTNRRWGLQGGIDVRNVSADMYFRGMKRLNMQGHARTTLSGMDAIEVVKGPPSPIYGMGRIGGYTNLSPKLGRAQTGAYLPAPQGFAQIIHGTWDRSETSFGVGGPVGLGEKQGGYYIYGLLEDSGTWVEPVHSKQKALQAAMSIDEAVGRFRLEVGTQYQNSNTAGAFMTRVTQDLIDNGRYIRGVPLVQLDTNIDGQVGFLETHLNSPVQGNVVSGNQPLRQTFEWPTDPATGEPYAFGEFPQIPGVPQSLYDHLVNTCGGVTGTNAACPDPTGLLRAQGVGGPVPVSGYVPIGMALDPRTVYYDNDPNYRRAAYEKEQDAELTLAFIDLVYDTNPDFTMKNQIFFDKMVTFKNSQLPYGENQDQWAFENKFTLTKRLNPEASWLRINSLYSVNYRKTRAFKKSSGGDWDYRNDIMAADGHLIPNASFWNQIENASYETGAPVTSEDDSEYEELGLGVMFDMDFFDNTNLLIGARYDYGDATTTDAERFAETRTSSSPCFSTDPFIGRILPAATAQGTDDGTSWSMSLSHKFPVGLVPYFTLATSSATLAGSDNQISRSAITAPGGFIGEAELKEVGLKASLLGEKLFITLAGYEQSRTDISDPDDPTEGADITSTEARGVELEMKWVPSRDVFVSMFALHQTTDYIFASDGSLDLNARDIGFTDVIDPLTGEVIFPAEAFLYGGKTRVEIPAALLAQYTKRNGSPEDQFGVNASYQITPKFGLNAGVVWYSEIDVTRVAAFRIPETTVVNAGVTWDAAGWRVQINASNLLDERYFRPRNGDSQYTIMSAMPGRSWVVTLKHDFL